MYIREIERLHGVHQILYLIGILGLLVNFGEAYINH